MVDLKKHLEMLGMRVRDRVTGFTGVVSTVGFDLYGCIQAIVNPGIDEKGDTRKSEWFDIGRLVATDSEPVMERPTFEWDASAVARGDKGPAERPLTMKA